MPFICTSAQLNFLFSILNDLSYVTLDGAVTPLASF